jgi:hypothetical protein
MVAACGVPTWTSSVQGPEAVPVDQGGDRWLKVHMLAGDLYVLESWPAAQPDGAVEGSGVHFDVDREATARGEFSIPRDSIALLETNDKEVVSGFAMGGLTVFTGLSTITTVACLADPKSCFGSCPTFYADAEADRPLAEGFSASFARALEASDLDHLGLHTSGEGVVSLVMRNEAHETHAVRRVRLVAAPPTPGGEVMLTAAGDLRVVTETRSARECTAGTHDCLADVRARDDVEYAPLADSSDLARREEVVLDFGTVAGTVGLVLSARHSLVSTYVFYQSLAYAGSASGELLAALERGEPEAEARALGMAERLGPIEIHARVDGGPWREAGSFDEAGPIAADRQLFPLGTRGGGHLEVRLRMARGAWRIDEARMARLGPSADALVVEPDSVTPLPGTTIGDGVEALRLLRDPDAHLVTTQGDAYRLWFSVPAGEARTLFLESEGYYYEWIRETWLEEENPWMTAMTLSDPAAALRAMAPGFKSVEAEMERLFWASRFRR